MVAKFCSRSHGQPVLGVRNAAMIASRRPISREGVITRILIGSRTANAHPIRAKKPLQESWPRIIHRRRLPPRIVGSRAGCFEQEPHAPLGLIDKVFQNARGRHVVVLVAELVAFTHRRGDLLIVVHQFAQHVVGRHKTFVVVFNCLQFRNLADGAQRGAADLAHALGKVVGGGEYLLGLLVEQQMIIAEMRAADMPMEILGLQVQRESIGQNLVELGRKLAHGVVGQIGRRIEGRADLARVEGSDFVVHGITLRNVAGQTGAAAQAIEPGGLALQREHDDLCSAAAWRRRQARDAELVMPVSAYVQAALFVIFNAVVLFAAAGTVKIVGFWVYVAIFAAVMVASFAFLDPGLLRERMRPGGQRPPLALRLFGLVLVLHWIVAGLDRGRFHWSDGVPAWLQAAGLIAVAGGYGLALCAMLA